MNTATIMDIAWEGAQVAFRLIMAARSRKDAEAIVHQLRALGPSKRADVDAIELEARRRLAPDFPGETCPDCGYVGDLSVGCPECSPHRVGGPLDGGD